MRTLVVKRYIGSLPGVYSEDGEECASDRVFNGYENVFAAAPTMLGALRVVLPTLITEAHNYCEEGSFAVTDENPLFAIIHIVKEAIAKAKGEQS